MPTLAEMLAARQGPRLGSMAATQNPQLMAIIAAALAKRRQMLQPQPQIAPMIGVRG